MAADMKTEAASMASAGSSSSQNEIVADDVRIILLHLPPELLVYILHYIDAREIYYNLRRVCRHLNTMLSDEQFWQRRMKAARKTRSTPIKLPEHIVNHVDFSWTRHCISAERECRRWLPRTVNSNAQPHMILNGAHMATVDCVTLCTSAAGKTLLLSGSRDRTITIFDVDQARQAIVTARDSDSASEHAPLNNNTQNYVHMGFKAHDGWVWSLANQTDDATRFISSGFDCKIKQWQIADERVTQLCSVSQPVAVLSVTTCAQSPHELLSTSFDGTLRVYDLRALQPTGSAAQHIMHCHTSAIPSCVIADNGEPYAYTAGDDRRVLCIDRRMYRVLTERQLPQSPVSLSFANRQLWFSTARGYVGLLDPYTQHLPSVMNMRVSTTSDPPRCIPSVKHTRGSVLCSCADRKIYILKPYLAQMPLITTLGPFTCEPTKMDYRNGDLVCGFSDGAIGLWTDLTGSNQFRLPNI